MTNFEGEVRSYEFLNILCVSCALAFVFGFAVSACFLIVSLLVAWSDVLLSVRVVFAVCACLCCELWMLFFMPLCRKVPVSNPREKRVFLPGVQQKYG